MKNNTEHTEENENVKNEASSSNDVENNPSEEELNNESTSEHDNDDKMIDLKTKKFNNYN